MRFLPQPNFHPPASEQNGDGESPPCSAGEGYRLTPLMAVGCWFFLSRRFYLRLMSGDACQHVRVEFAINYHRSLKEALELYVLNPFVGRRRRVDDWLTLAR